MGGFMDRTSILDHVRKHADERPDHPAVIEENGKSITYNDLWQQVVSRGDDFRNAGIQKGDPCAFTCSSGIPFLIHSLGLLAAGGCLVPVPEEHRDKPASPYFSELPLTYLIDEENGFDPEPVTGAPSLSIREAEFKKTDPAYVRFTSGTTSERKGVLLGHDAILERTAAANRALQVNPEDRILWLLPMVHHYVSSILLYLRNGSTLLLPETPLADPVITFMKDQQATLLYATPVHFRRFTGADLEEDLETVRLAISTATSLSPRVAQNFSERFGCPISQALGIIEVGLPAMNLERPRKKPDSVGQVLPDYEVTPVADSGDPVPEGINDTGELHVNGPGLFDAYLTPWTPREDVVNEFGFPTGDQGYFDDDGDLYLTGRRANRIDMAGMKFFCEEVENVLNQYPAVKTSRVYGADHEKLGEVPRAEVVVEPEETAPDPNELKSFCRTYLESHKIPRTIEITDRLPRTPTGKIKRT